MVGTELNGCTDIVEVGEEDSVIVQVKPNLDASVAFDPISSDTIAGQLQSYLTTSVDEIVEL